MSDGNTGFCEEVKRAIRRHDPTADELRDLAQYLEQRADRYEEL